MPIITSVIRKLRKRNFEQLRPYTAERIQAKSQGVPVEVDKEVLRNENSIKENYGGYVEDETDLSFVENDVGESQEDQWQFDQEPQGGTKVLGKANRRNVVRSPTPPNVLRDITRENIDLSTSRKSNVSRNESRNVNVEGQHVSSSSTNEGDLNSESGNEEEIESVFSSINDEPVSISNDESNDHDGDEIHGVDIISSDDETYNYRTSSDVISQRGSISSRSSRPSEQNLVSKKLKDLLQWADTTPVSSPNDKNFPIEKYLELFEELHKNIYVGNPWPEPARSLIRDLMMYWAGWRPNNNGINNCYKILVKLIVIVPINACNVPDITILTQRYLDLTLQLLGRIIDDTPIDHVNEFISKFNKHTRVLINNMRCKGVQDKANENIAIAICSVIALINKKPMSEYILNRFTYISKRNQEWIIRSLMLLNQTLKMLTSYGNGTKQTLLDLFELLKRKCRDGRMDPEVKLKAKECLETVKAIN
ncbi:6327_t:CDS:2 [Funneliformis geosporum]|uniref:15595_t:CDS:1 n=1 Tax=Funneliformis geosporum TaxID=1117311 RepID=A0A9W4SAI7_9GLOM|nr:15595_t:CDS:2 [Funneliformis geosporum]CAI2165675.1 6327_t:CDS:2 [Funneliformis geosporum]